MCQLKEEVKPKTDQILEALNRLADAVERLEIRLTGLSLGGAVWPPQQFYSGPLRPPTS